MNKKYRAWLENVRDTCIAALDGKQIEEKPIDACEEREWWPWPTNTGFNTNCRYRAVQPTISVNGFNVPRPMDAPQLKGQTYFVATPSSREFFNELAWDGDEIDSLFLNRRVMHSTKEAAIMHAKAMLGIDPNTECGE